MSYHGYNPLCVQNVQGLRAEILTSLINRSIRLRGNLCGNTGFYEDVDFPTNGARHSRGLVQGDQVVIMAEGKDFNEFSWGRGIWKSYIAIKVLLARE